MRVCIIDTDKSIGIINFQNYFIISLQLVSKIMVDNIIEKIKESEEKAKEIINLSKKESAEIVEKAYSKSKEILEETKKEISDMISKYETKAKSDAKKEIEVLQENFDKDLSNIKKAASHREEEAVNKIVQRISN